MPVLQQNSYDHQLHCPGAPEPWLQSQGLLPWQQYANDAGLQFGPGDGVGDGEGEGEGEGEGPKVLASMMYASSATPHAFCPKGSRMKPPSPQFGPHELRTFQYG